MSPAEIEALVQRLVVNPHDQEAINAAHRAGQSDPRGYAALLEKVGNKTSDPAFSSHWLSEAANVWSTTLGDPHRAARALMQAVDRDPSNAVPAERLATLYRDKGDVKALVALLERRAKALQLLVKDDTTIGPTLAALHEELGRLWSEPPLAQARKAIDHYRRAVEYDPASQYAIYGLRELYKAERKWAEAIPYFEMEQRLVVDPERQLALYLDEADVRTKAGDRKGAAAALRGARSVSEEEDPTLKQQLATVTLERVQANEPVDVSEKNEAVRLFVELSETYPGEHGFSYASCALQVDASHDRAAQLSLYYAQQLQREAEIAPFVAQYVLANPDGIFAADARSLISRVVDKGEGDEALLEALVPPSSAASTERVTALLSLAHALTRKGRKREALDKYKEVLTLQPSNEDALAVIVAQLRQGKKFAELRDVWLAASRDPESDVDARKTWLREVAMLCQSQLRDMDGAITAWRELLELEPLDDVPRAELKRLLERAARWDDLAEVLREEAEQTSDLETRLVTEKALAKLHETERHDLVAAGETWGRIAGLSPDDGDAIWKAVRFLEKAGQPGQAMAVIEDNVQAVVSPPDRAELWAKLGKLRLGAGDPGLAGAAFSEAAGLVEQDALWAEAEEAFAQAEDFGQAASAAGERARLAEEAEQQAAFLAREAEHLTRAGDAPLALARLEQATERAPGIREHAEALETLYKNSSRYPDLAKFLLRRAAVLTDAGERVLLRKKAAEVQREELADLDGARQTLKLVLEDSDDPDALLALADDAEQFGENTDAVDYLHRLVNVTEDVPTKVRMILREAGLVAEGLGDPAGAIKRYEAILKKFDDKNEPALTALASLHTQADDHSAAAEVLERHLGVATDSERLVQIAEQLADLYDGPLEDPAAAIRVLARIRELDPEDYGALQRLCDLERRVESWPAYAEHLAELLEVEGDPQEISRMTRDLAEVLHTRCERSTEALAALEQVADEGDAACREEYVKLGDLLGWSGIVATKLVEWHFGGVPGAERTEALRGAFNRYVDVGRREDAARVAKELARGRGANADVAKKLESVALEIKDLEALHIAHDVAVENLTGPARAEEMVRQAEVLASAGIAPLEAIQHGEQALTSVAPSDVEPLLARLGRLAPTPTAVVDIYERQIGRCKAPADRLKALGRAAHIAGEQRELDRARALFDVALSGVVHEDTLNLLENVAREADRVLNGTALRLRLAEALAAGGQGSRDGGKTRGAVLGRAAELAFRELKDVDRAFGWVGDAIVAHVEDARLDQLEKMARELGQMARAETVLSRALEEIFDGPLVRKLLGRRAALRRDHLNNKAGAALDLKRLHDLSAGDASVMAALSQLYVELRDYRGMVQLYEDQILRGKDQEARAELARKVARLWEHELDDAREAADAWRRVLRMKSGDAEAQGGLERAKANMLNPKKKAPPPSEPEAAPSGSVIAAPSGPSVTASAEGAAVDTVTARASGAAAAMGADETAIVPPRGSPSDQRMPSSSPAESAGPVSRSGVEGPPSAGPRSWPGALDTPPNDDAWGEESRGPIVVKTGADLTEEPPIPQARDAGASQPATVSTPPAPFPLATDHEVPSTLRTGNSSVPAPAAAQDPGADDNVAENNVAENNDEPPIEEADAEVMEAMPPPPPSVSGRRPPPPPSAGASRPPPPPSVAPSSSREAIAGTSPPPPSGARRSRRPPPPPPPTSSSPSRRPPPPRGSGE